MRHADRPITKADLTAALEKLYQRLKNLLITKFDLDRLYVKLKKHFGGILSTEKAILDKLKEHEERLNALEDLHPPVN